MPHTVQDVIDTIMAAVPGERLEQTVDTLKTGRPDTVVTGVATTFLATLDVLRRAARLGANLVITHEPTFYQGRDDTRQLEGDRLLDLKRRFIEDNGVAIWRFHDYWHRHQPDGILTGATRRLGWQAYQAGDKPRLFVLPPTTLAQLAKTVKETFAARSVRVIGDPALRCSKVALLPGAPGAMRQIEALRRDDVEVLIGGESREWETVEYVRDAVAAGAPKALILAGHCASEEPGMEYLAQWLRERLPDVPVTFVAAGDPFWPA